MYAGRRFAPAPVRRPACPAPQAWNGGVSRHYVNMMRKRRPGLRPNCCGLMKCSVKMPPFASMTRCDAMLSGDLYARKADCLGFRKCEARSEEHTSELQSRRDLVCRLLLEKKK